MSKCHLWRWPNNSISKSYSQEVFLFMIKFFFSFFPCTKECLQARWFLTLLLCAVDFTSIRPRCREIGWILEGWQVKLREAFFILYTQAFYKEQWIFPSGGVHFLLAKHSPLFFPVSLLIPRSSWPFPDFPSSFRAPHTCWATKPLPILVRMQ